MITASGSGVGLGLERAVHKHQIEGRREAGYIRFLEDVNQHAPRDIKAVMRQ